MRLGALAVLVALVVMVAVAGLRGAWAQEDVLDCPDLDSQAEAQEFLRYEPDDPDNLDDDDDGIACETEPYDDPARDENPVPRGGTTTGTH